MGSTIQRVPIAFAGARGAHLPLTGGAANSVAIRPPAIPGAIEWQTLGVSSDSFTISVPAIGALAFSDVPYSCTPTGFPVAFQLAPNASGIIMVELGFPTLPAGLGIAGISQSLRFGKGAPTESGSASWVLQPRQAYQSATITGSVRFFTLGAASAVTVTMVASSLLICKPPAVTG